MKFIEILKALGLDAVLLIAGIAGGIASLTNGSKLTKWQKFITVLSGGFSANYLTPLVAKWFELDDVLYGVAFLLGYGGLKGVESFYLYLINRSTNKS